MQLVLSVLGVLVCRSSRIAWLWRRRLWVRFTYPSLTFAWYGLVALLMSAYIVEAVSVIVYLFACLFV